MSKQLPVIFFDWDGTLGASLDHSLAHLKLTFKRLGLPPFDPARSAEFNGPSIPGAFPLMNLPQERFDEYVAVRRQAELDCVADYAKLFPGIRELLAHLKGRARLAVVFNGYEGYLKSSMETTGVASYFDWVFPLVEGQSKGVTLGQALARIQPERAIMVGDHTGDFAAGRMNNLPTIGVGYGYGTAEELAQADYRAATVADLQIMLDQLIG